MTTIIGHAQMEGEPFLDFIKNLVKYEENVEDANKQCSEFVDHIIISKEIGTDANKAVDDIHELRQQKKNLTEKLKHLQAQKEAEEKRKNELKCYKLFTNSILKKKDDSYVGCKQQPLQYFKVKETDAESLWEL